MLKKVKTIEKIKETSEIGDLPEVKNPANIDVNISTSDHSNLKELVEKNIKWSQVIYEQNKKIKHRLTMMVIGSYLRLAIILIPLILAFIYLPPLLKNVLNQYQSVLDGVSGSPSEINNLLGQVSSGQLQEILKVFGNR